jgi:GNAT superfamily N-acetyltransferase
VESARRATIEDLDRLVELAGGAHDELRLLRGGAIWAVREARPGPLSDAYRALLDDDGQLLVAGVFAGYVVGFGSVRTETLRDGRLLAVVDDVYVEPPFRGVSVGEAVMDALIEWAQARGCTGIDSLALPGDRDTKNFFERFGLKARALVVHRSFVEPEPEAEPAATVENAADAGVPG